MGFIYNHLDAYLGKKNDRPAPDGQTKTRVKRTQKGNIQLIYHTTPVVTAFAGGDWIALDTGGWETKTTKDRMERLVRLLRQEKNGVYKNVHVRGSITTSRGRPKKYQPWCLVTYVHTRDKDNKFVHVENEVAPFISGQAIFKESWIPPIEHYEISKEAA